MSEESKTLIERFKSELHTTGYTSSLSDFFASQLSQAVAMIDSINSMVTTNLKIILE